MSELTVVQLKKLVSKYNLRNAMKGYSKMKKTELLAKINSAGYKPNDDKKNPQLIPITQMKRKTIIK